MIHRLVSVFFLFASLPVVALDAADITLKDEKILFQGKALHPGCFELIAGDLNGDDITLVANVEFERPKDQFIGRGCMSANVYFQPSFMREAYLSYTRSEENLKKAQKDPLFRFDGFGYKLNRKISDNIYAVDVRQFTQGSNDFLGTLVVEFVVSNVTLVTPQGKVFNAKVLSMRKIGTILNGVVSLQEKIQEILKMREIIIKESSKKKSNAI